MALGNHPQIICLPPNPNRPAKDNNEPERCGKIKVNYQNIYSPVRPNGVAIIALRTVLGCANIKGSLFRGAQAHRLRCAFERITYAQWLWPKSCV